jgi:hypothetical protein
VRAETTVQANHRYQLISGDCLEALKAMPDGAVDIVVTSPPYNTLSKMTQGSGIFRDLSWIKKVNAIGYSDSRPEPDYQEWLRMVVAECLRVSKGLVWINHKVRYRKGVGIHPMRMFSFPLWCEVIWQRAGSMDFNKRRFPASHGCHGLPKTRLGPVLTRGAVVVWRPPRGELGRGPSWRRRLCASPRSRAGGAIADARAPRFPP